jgi:hypothetical protein
MDFIVHTNNASCIAELRSDGIEISETQDALDMMADARQLGANTVIVHAYQLNAKFFDLKSGVAGDILQKFSNYRMKLAIIGDFSIYQSKSLRDFIFESNKTGRIFFLPSLDEAKLVLFK